MKTSYIFLGIIAMLMWNMTMIKRDQEMWKKYDQTKTHQEYCNHNQQSPTCK